MSNDAPVVIVTGAAQGIGKACAERLALDGWGVVRTDRVDSPGRSSLDDWVSHRVPMGRLGDRNEVATVVRFLVRDAPEYLTGARITVDGATEAWA